MGAPPNTRALLLGADESLAALLSDVLREVGITVQTARGARPDLVLALSHRSESLMSTLLCARDGTWPAPVFMLMPFADERVEKLALRLGARGCFALGQPLHGLCQMLLQARLPPVRDTHD